ncbi:MAG: hypothetical protein O9301_14460 [Leptospira sp.]|nr:hypothetical protein [Leptospira sp.]
MECRVFKRIRSGYLHFSILLCLPWGPIQNLGAETNLELLNTKERSGSFLQRKPDDKIIVTLYPGYQYRANNLTVSSPNGTKVRLQEFELSNSQPFLDIKTRDFQVNSIIGSYVLFQNYTIEQTTQSSDLSLGGLLVGSNTSINGSPYQTKDLGTVTKGRIYSLMPVIYIGESGKENFRFGLGVGISNVSLQGNPDFYDGLGTQIPLANLSLGGPLQERLDSIGKLALFRSGQLERDPINLYLLSNLSADGNLELLGLYQLSKGNLEISKLNPYTLYWLQQFSNGSLSELEIITLANLGKSDLKFNHRLVSNFYSFFEVPFWEIVIRFGYGGPVYYEDGYRFTFRNLDISTYLPIDL